MEHKLFKTLIEDLDCTVVERECYDSQSGWTGLDVYIKQNSTGLFLHENGKFEDEQPQYETYNVSGNGYCLSDKSRDEAYVYTRKALIGEAPDLVMARQLRSPYRCLDTLYTAIPYDKKDEYVSAAYKTLYEYISKNGL